MKSRKHSKEQLKQLASAMGSYDAGTAPFQLTAPGVEVIFDVGSGMVATAQSGSRRGSFPAGAAGAATPGSDAALGGDGADVQLARWLHSKRRNRMSVGTMENLAALKTF
ncbi:unnamed protein product [Phaeothamnion confervicola]